MRFAGSATKKNVNHAFRVAGNSVTIKMASFSLAGPRKPKHNVGAAVEIATVTIELRALAMGKHQIITLQLLKRI